MEDPIIDVCYGVIPYFKKPNNELEFLVITQQDTHTGFPKGHPDEGEKPQETAERELAEETGITNSVLDTTKIYSSSYTFIDKNNKTHSKTVYFYLAEIPEQTAKTPKDFSEEITATYWGSYKEVREKLTYEDIKLLLDEALNDLMRK